MKILYGVQGTGNGHIARARAMAVAFRQQNIDVDFLFSGRDESKYFSMEAFGNYQTRSGLTFYSEQGQVKYGKTFMKNNIWRFLREINQIDLTPYDLVINDFEPVTAWAAKRQGVPCIGISHQNAFRYDVPKEGGNWIEHSVIQHFAPTEHSIGLHWYHFEQPILPPIVHTLVGEQQTKTAQDFTLVYLPFEDLESISELLMKFISHNFVCYHPDVLSTAESKILSSNHSVMRAFNSTSISALVWSQMAALNCHLKPSLWGRNCFSNHSKGSSNNRAMWRR